MTRDTFDHFAQPERGLFADPPSPTGYGAAGHESAGEVTLDCVLHHETDLAIKVSDDGRELRAIWMPKRQLKIFRGGINARAIRRDGQIARLPVISVTVPEGLAREKGLI